MHLCPSSKNFTHSFEGVPHLDLGTTNAIKIPLKGNAQKQKIGKILKGAQERVYPTRTQGKIRWR